MTVLIFTPTFGAGPRAETLRSVSQQSFTDYDHEVSWHNPYPGEKFKNVVAQYQRGWQLALDGGYDALLTVEHDMVLPTDALEKLMATDAPVVYGVYMLRHGTPTLSAWQYTGKGGLGMSLSLYPKEVAAARSRGWCEVSGVGWGCTLIRREVLQRLTVRGSDKHDAGDLKFATDCVKAGIKQIARFDVLCGHYHEDGTLLEPFQGVGTVSRVYALVDVVANIKGQSVAMKKGRYYTVPLDVGTDLARAGYVSVTNEETETADAVPVMETAVPKRTRKAKNVS